MKETIINLDVREKKYFVSKYNDDVIDPELSAYISNYMIGTDIENSVKMIISTEYELTKEEKDKFSNVIKKEFIENIYEIKSEIKKSNIRKIILSISGVLLIALSYFIDNEVNNILSQVVNIFGWVAIWDVAYSMFFGDVTLKKSMKRYMQLYNSSIDFKTKK